MKNAPSKVIDIDFLEYHNSILSEEWVAATKLMHAMLDTPPNGLYSYDMLPTLRRMEELYLRIAATTETIRYAKREVNQL